MPKVSNNEGSSLKNVRTVSLGQSPLAPAATNENCHVWSITGPANRGQVHPSVTAGTTYVDLHGPRTQPEEIYKVRPKANGNNAIGDWRFVKLEGGKGLLLLRGNGGGSGGFTMDMEHDGCRSPRESKSVSWEFVPLTRTDCRQVENPAFYDTEPSGFPANYRPFKTFPSAFNHQNSNSLKKFNQSGLGSHHHHHQQVPRDSGSNARLEKRSWLRWWKLRFRKTTSHNHQAPGGGGERGGACACCSRRRCPLAVVIGVSLLLVLLIVAIAVVLYLTVGGGLQAFSEEEFYEGFWAVEGEFRITNRAYLSDMSDPNTSSFAALASEVVRSLDELFLQSALVKDYNGSDISAFSHGSVVVICRIFLNKPFSNAAQEVGLAFVRGLEQGHGTLPAGNLQVDIRSIKFTGLRGIYPPPKSSREILIPDAAWSQWSDWSTCTDHQTGQCLPKKVQSRSRDCRIDKGYGDALPNTNACRKLGGTKAETRECVCQTDQSGSNSPKTETNKSPPDQSGSQEETSTGTGNYLNPPNSGGRSHSLNQPYDAGRGHFLNPPQPSPSEGTSLNGNRGHSLNPPDASHGTRGHSLNQPDREDGQGPLGSTAQPDTHSTSRQMALSTNRANAQPAEAARSEESVVPTTYRPRLNKPASLIPEAERDSVRRNTSISFYGVIANKKGKPCQDCKDNEICFVSAGSSEPKCTIPKDASDPRGCGGLCDGLKELCRKVDPKAFKCVDASECFPGEFKCGDGLCIPEIRRCDGHFNCYDTTDELNCECKSDEFHCGNKTSCLPLTLKCNGHVECWDGSDEVNCTTSCPQNQHTCSNGQCIPKDQYCDRFKDCADGSDEPAGCDGPCSNDMFQCSNKRCVYKLLVCNGRDDCGDRSDERLCAAGIKPLHPFHHGATPTSSTRTTVSLTRGYSSAFQGTRQSSSPSPDLNKARRDEEHDGSSTSQSPILVTSGRTWLPVWKET